MLPWWLPIAMNEEGTERFLRDVQKEEWFQELSPEEQREVIKEFFDRFEGLSY